MTTPAETPADARVDTMARNKAVVAAFYDGAVRGDITGFAAQLDREFIVEVPDNLPWGGVHGREAYLTRVLPQVGSALDFGRFGYESITAEDDRVIALIRVGVAGSDAMIRISEHWTLKGEQAVALWVAYYEAKTLLDQLARSTAHAVRA
jgi:ketosteroid isomerase-like protein